MKKQSIFPGIILVGIGGYLLLQQLNVTVFDGFFSWPTIVMIIGIALLIHAYTLNDHSNIFPGIVLTGFGFHFHHVNQLSFWPDHFSMLILIVSIGMLLRYLKTKAGLSHGLLLLAISLLFLKYDLFMGWLSFFKDGFSFIIRFWPILLIGAGIYLLFIKKK